jgi:hypothetical protein
MQTEDEDEDEEETHVPIAEAAVASVLATIICEAFDPNKRAARVCASLMKLVAKRAGGTTWAN